MIIVKVKSRLPSIAKIFVVEMGLASPSAGITEAVFRDKAVDVRIPFINVLDDGSTRM